MIDSRLILAVHPVGDRLEPLFAGAEKMGAKVVAATDNASAMRFLLDKKPDIAIVDTSPESAAEDAAFCGMSRREALISHIPAAVFAPDAHESVLLELIRSGADRLIDCPVNVAIELAWIERSILRSDQATLDPGTGLYRTDYLQRAAGSLTSGVSPEWTLLLIKLTNLKAYNACHGYERGDALIAEIARMVKRESRAYAGAWEVAGRWDSSTLAVMTPVRRSDSLAQRIVNNSTAALKKFFSPHEWAKGEVEIERPLARTNKSEMERFPLVHLIVGGVRVPARENCHPNLVFDHAKEVLDEVEQDEEGQDVLIEPL